MTTRILLIITLLLAVALPIAGLALYGGWLPVAGVVLAALLWFLGVRYHNHPLINLAFTGLLAMDVMVMLNPHSALFGQAGGLFALAAWDLSRFSQRLELIYPPDSVGAYEKKHLLRLGAVLAVAALLAALTDLVRFNYAFVPAFFLSLLVMIGFRVVLSGLAKIKPEEEDSVPPPGGA
jgi:hypothetical protein